MPLIAALGFDPDSITTTLKNGALVVLAGVIGYVVTALMAWGFDQWISKKPSPRALHKLVRWFGAMIAAVLAALYLFGGGFGHVRGPGTGGTTDSTAPSSGGPPPSTTPATANTPTTRPSNTAEAPPTVALSILGGFREDQRYYRLDDDGSRLATFEEAKSYILQHRRESKPPTVLAIRLDPVNRTTRDNRLVRQLEEWATREVKMAVDFPGDGP